MITQHYYFKDRDNYPIVDIVVETKTYCDPNKRNRTQKKKRKFKPL